VNGDALLYMSMLIAICWCMVVPVSCMFVYVDTSWCMLILIDMSWCIEVRVELSWCSYIYGCVLWCMLMYVGVCWYVMPCVDTCLRNTMNGDLIIYKLMYVGTYECFLMYSYMIMYVGVCW